MPRRILVIDDVATNRIILKVKLAAAYYDVLQAETPEAGFDMATTLKPDLIVLDLSMTAGGGLELCRKLRAAPESADTPIIALSTRLSHGRKMEALEAGADDVLPKPIEDHVLLARVRCLLRARDAEEELLMRDGTRRALGFGDLIEPFSDQARVALLAPTPETGGEWLEMLGKRLRFDFRAVTAKEVLTAEPFDVYVIAAHLSAPEEGLRLLSELRAQAETRHCGIIIVMSRGDRRTGADALDLGANDLLIDGFEADELALRLSTQVRRKLLSDRLRGAVKDGLRAAVTDPLTGLYNRRYALPHLQAIHERAARTGRRFAVMLADLDHFKSINDTYGHAAGDAVLVEVAQRLRDNLRAVDLVARFGGEEFLIVMPETGRREARSAARRLCRVISETPVRLGPGGTSIPVTVSIGAAIGNGAQTGGSVPPVNALISQADKALYGAKAEGRNQVTLGRPAA